MASIPSEIPKARVLIEQVLSAMMRTGGDHRLIAMLQEAVAKMHRAPYCRKASTRHRSWSDKTLKGDILATANAHPDWTLQEISIACNSNTARVSEALNGLV